MKRLVVSSLAVAAAALTSGCGLHTGFYRDTNTIQQFDIRLEASSVKYARSVRGSADIGMVFCAIPIGEEMYAEAMNRLYAAASLGPNEIVTNFREDNSFTIYLGFYCKQRVTISGDVFQITAAAGHPATSATPSYGAPSVPSTPPAPPTPPTPPAPAPN